MATVLDKQAKRWTYEEYCKLDDDQRHEIIDGNLLMAPAPDTSHQTWLGNLYILLVAHTKKHQSGRVLVSPLDVVLDSENTVEPDLIFVSAARANIIEHRGIFGAPDLLVEIISPSSVRRDRYDKKELYARFCVKEYWIADPANKSLEILTLKENGYVLHSSAEEKGKVTSVLLTSLEFDILEIQ